MKRAVHALAHDVGQDRARGADQRAGDDERRIAEREADAGRRPARIGIEHRDHDRHVGAADRDDDEHAEARRRCKREQPEREIALATRRTRRCSTTSATASAMLMTWRAGRMIGAPLMRPESLRKAITEPVKVMAPMATPSDISTRLDLWIAPTRADVEGGRRIERAGRHQHRRHADQRVEGGDQLRHRRHRHAARDHRADAAADREAERSPAPRRRRRPADARRAW